MATTATPAHDPRAIGRGAAQKRRMLWIRGYGPINGRQSLGRSIAIEKAVLPRHPLQLPDTETNHGGHGKGHDQRCTEREPAHQAYRSLACLAWGHCERDRTSTRLTSSH